MNNARVNRWIEKIQHYDFRIEYVKGEEMGLADELSRQKITNGIAESKLGERIKQLREI